MAESRTRLREKQTASLPKDSKDRPLPVTPSKSPLLKEWAGKEGAGLRKVGPKEREKGQFSRLKFVPSLQQ
jgi:hypothetical protein